MTSPVRTDRLDAARYPVVATALRAEARRYQTRADQETPDRSLFDTFAEPVRNLLAKHAEETAVALNAMAAQAQAFADEARERLGLAEDEDVA